jgi:hydroxymethylpyrimidine pyrophosphatase-like HAD family hydrolase
LQDPEPPLRIAPWPDLLYPEPVVLKILIRASDIPAEALWRRALEVLPHDAEPVHSGSGHGLLEVSASGVNKARALADLVADWGFGSDDVLAFGDMPNDLPMLRWAGRSVAMADGHHETQAAADRIAPGCADDGVAQVLEELIAGPG